MKKRLSTILQYLFFIGLAVFFMWLSLRSVEGKDWKDLQEALSRAQYWLLLPVFGLLLLSHWLRMLRWRQLIEPLGYHPSKMNTFFSVLIGYFVNQGAPRLGEVVKCTLLTRYEKIPAEKLVGTIVAERAFDVVCLLIIFGLTFIFQYNVIYSLIGEGFFASDSNHNEPELAVAKYVLWSLLIIALLWVVYIIIKNGIGKLVARFRTIFSGVWMGLISSRNLKNKPLFFIYTVCIWLLYWASTYMGFMVLAETRHLTPIDALTILAVGSVAMIVSPGGTGAYPVFIQKTVLLYGIAEKPFGIAFGWLMWFGQFITYVVFGIFSFVLLPYFNKNRDEKP
jgi:glycosyltransferase 2 family protein